MNKDKSYTNSCTTLNSEDDEVVYVPMEVIRDFDKIFSWVKEARYELGKVMAAMKPIEN